MEKKGVKIFIGSDHAGFKIKEEIRKYLDSNGFNYEDITPIKKEGDDYPLYAFEVGKRVVKSKGGRGILVCGSDTDDSLLGGI